jgi:predicted ribosome quality control (RQC) complex YloA/Tae2 family protein
MVIHLEADEEIFLRVGLDSQTPFFLIDNARNIKDPRTFFFSELTSHKIDDLNILPFDKIIYLTINDYTLNCVFYGREKNIILFDSKKSIVGSFKKISTDKNSNPVDIPLQLSSIEDLLNIDRAKIQENLISFMTGRIGGFNKRLIEEICYRSEIYPDLPISGISDSDWNKIVQNIIKIKEEFKQKDCYLYEHNHDSTVLSLVKLQKLSEDYKLIIYPDVNTAWKQFIYRFQQKHSFNRILNRSREKILKRINYLEKTLKKVTDFKDLEEKKIQSELKGHLLQTFSSDIKKGVDLVKLKNIYTIDEKYISVKLNPKLSVQENALRYFNKYKDINDKKETLKSKRDTYNDELIFWKKKYHESEKIDNLKKAEKLDQLLYQKKLIQKGKTTKKAVSTLDISSFNRVLLKGQWEILIGKNAENNDLLTFKFARKHDIWLHAQGVSGSHVVIRLPDKNTEPPMDLIKQAASIAAFFSSAKNSSTVPVNYTEVRYVRKPRKASPGTALITNSKTIFVEPKKYI